MMHWKELDTPGKIEAVKQVWEPGMSAADIARQFDGASRGAVIGMFYRYAGHLAPCFLKANTNRKWKANVVTKPRKPREPKAKKPQREKFKQTTVVHFKPLARPEPYRVRSDGVSTAGRPILQLEAGQCRWPVNDAAPDELHLFCGLPSQGSYCDHHAARSARMDRGER